MLSFFVRLFLFTSIMKLSLGLSESIVNQFVTCDFDLEEDAHFQLPVECENLDNATRAALLEEAKSFKRFHAKLQDYEESLNLNTDEDIYKDWKFRAELYGNAELHLCQNSTDILQEYLECMMEKRTQMILEIDQKIASISDD